MYYAMGILIALLTGLGYLYSEELTSHGITKAELTQSRAAVVAIQNAVLDMSVKQAKVSNENLKATLELRETRRQLDSLRNKEKVLISQPEMVTKLINLDFIKDEEELACLTGDTAVCQ